MEELKTYKLEELTIGKGEYGIGASAVPLDSSKYTYLRITDINDDGTLNKQNLMSVDDINACNYILKKNDIVFARTGNSTGRSYFYDGSDGVLVYAGFLIKFSIDVNKVNPRILKYYTHSKPYFDWVHSFDTGGTRGNINAKTYGTMPIILPSRKIQDKIVSILKTLDDKIELNRRINENLEQQAQALFKSWFVDFEPFKDGKFVDSELGMIPEGWKVISIGEIVKEMNTGGDAIQKTPIVEYNTGIKCIRVGDFTNNRAVNDWGFTNVNDDIYKQYKLNRGDILITRTASIGLVRYIFNDLNAVYNNGIIRLIINENVLPSLFVYCYLNSCLFSNHISKIIGETSVRPNMKINYVSKFKLLLPTNTVSNKFTSIVSSIYGKIEKNILEIYKLSQLRDTLLPRLMSGELEIKDNSYD